MRPCALTLLLLNDIATPGQLYYVLNSSNQNYDFGVSCFTFLSNQYHCEQVRLMDSVRHVMEFFYYFVIWIFGRKVQ